MKTTPKAELSFHEGDEVVLACGTYEGTPGMFLRTTADVKWVEITHRNGMIRAHPLEWLAHAKVT